MTPVRDPIDGGTYWLDDAGNILAGPRHVVTAEPSQFVPPPYGEPVRPTATETDPSALEREHDAVQSALVWQRAHREVAIARVAQVVCPWIVGALIFAAVMYASCKVAWRDGYRQAQIEQAQRGRL